MHLQAEYNCVEKLRGNGGPSLTDHIFYIASVTFQTPSAGMLLKEHTISHREQIIWNNDSSP